VQVASSCLIACKCAWSATPLSVYQVKNWLFQNFVFFNSTLCRYVKEAKSLDSEALEVEKEIVKTNQDTRDHGGAVQTLNPKP
jgi:hypothetical protein